MAALITLLSVPVMILNMFSGIIGGVWLAVDGHWSLIGLGLAAMFISTIGLSLALAPSLIFSAPAMMAIEKGKTIIAGVLIAVSNLWTCAVITVWCVGSFYIVFGFYETGSMWPYLLWAYSTATGPWTYMATRDRQDTATASTFGAFGACVGTIAMMGVTLFKAQPSIIDLLIAVCVPLAVVFVIQVWVGFKVARAAQAVQAEP